MITASRLLFFACASCLFAGPSCNNGMGSGMEQLHTANPPEPAPCKTPRKITAIYPMYVYDLNGYDGVSGGSAFNLFDENGAVDPRTDGPDAYRPQTSCMPTANVVNYFPDRRGNRIVVDLRVPYRLGDIYIFDRARNSDSIWIYTGDMQHWTLKAALATYGDVTRWGWRKFNLGDSSRYIMIRLNSPEANITESVLYGCPLGPEPAAPPDHYTGPKLPPKTIREFLGVNSYQGVPLEFMKPFYNTRLYTTLSHVDADTVHEMPDVNFHVTEHGWWNGAIGDYVFFGDSIVRVNQARLWYSILGVPRYLEKQGLGNHDRPVTRKGMDTENPASYARHASMMWNLAAAMGSRKVDTSLIHFDTRPRFSGRDLLHVYENGNEVDAYWVGNKYCNPIEYYAISSADYDGDEGRLGDKMGIKQADAGAELMTSGFCTPDTNRLRILDFLCRNLRSDKQFLWKGGVQYHHYSMNGKGHLPGDVFTRSTGGLSPEEDSLRIKLARVRDYTYRIQPGVECILGEYGYDKSLQSKVSAPPVPGFDRQQSQGIMLMRGINSVAFAGFDRLTLYWIKDDYGPDQPAMFLSSGLINQVSTSEHHPYSSWFYLATLVNRLGDYVPDRIISEEGKVWVYRYRHRQQPDSVAYFVYCPTHNGSKVNGYALNLGKRAEQAEIVRFADKSVTGNSQTVPVSGGRLSLNVVEIPQLVFTRQ